MPKSESEQAKLTAKELRARDAVQAMKDYREEQLAVREKTARLRALRLAKEAAAKPER